MSRYRRRNRGFACGVGEGVSAGLCYGAAKAAFSYPPILLVLFPPLILIFLLIKFGEFVDWIFGVKDDSLDEQSNNSEENEFEHEPNFTWSNV